jgi:predicted RNA-binding Zn ribbon-like protein
MVTPTAGHLAFEFLNTRPRLYDPEPDELLPDGDSLLAFLVRSGAFSLAEAAEARRRFSEADLDALAPKARSLREDFRVALATWKRGRVAISPRFLAEVSRLLASAPQVLSVETAGRRIVLRSSRRLVTPEALLAPLAEACVRLLLDSDRRLARECASPTCSLWFYDTTRSHRRRWCSMSVCGARAKAKAYRRRRSGKGRGKQVRAHDKSGETDA